jgi:dipeptidyl aminopeptidase/acylaminoacyl peptidase
VSTGVNGFLWAGDKTLVVASEVYMDCGADDACNKKKMDEAAKGSSARVYGKLLYRHWDTWEDGRVGHLLAFPLEAGTARDLTPGDRDAPPFSLGGPDDYDVSPDGRELCFSRNLDPVEATSTNAELFVVPVSGGEPKRIAGSPGYDGAPRYSPDGAKIAFRAQMRAGYESDRWRLMLYDRKSGQTANLTEAFDRHVEGLVWSPDSRLLFFTPADNAREPIFAVRAVGRRRRSLTARSAPAVTSDERRQRDASRADPSRRGRAAERRRQRPRPRHESERRFPGRVQAAAGRERQLHRRRGQDDPGLDRQARRLRSCEEVPGPHLCLRRSSVCNGF